MAKNKTVDHIKEFQDFLTANEHMEVAIDDSVHYNLDDKIREETRLYNRMFSNGKEILIDESGYENGFIAKAMVVWRTLIQGSDVDLKNLDITPLQHDRTRVIALLRMLFFSILSRQQFGDKMDDILGYMCWYGSAVVKRHKKGVDLVDLRNYITEAHEQDPQKRRHQEADYLTWSDMKTHKEEWKDSWGEIEELWEAMQKQNVSTFRVLIFSTWGKVNEGDEIKKICVKFLDKTIIDWEDTQKPTDWSANVQLEAFVYPKILNPYTEEEEPMFPYTQFDLFRIPGRWKSMGCGELLHVPQIKINELYNNKGKLDLKALMGLTVYTMKENSDESSVTQEQLSQIKTGTVFTIKQGESLNNLPVDTKSGEFKLMVDEYYELMLQLIGITAQGTGEEMPASTSATQAAINKQNADTVFDYTKERFHHGIDKLFNLGYANDIIDALDKENAIAIIGDPARLEQFDNFLIDNALNNWVAEKKKVEGAFPSEEEVFQEKQRLKADLKELGDSRFPTIKKEILKDLPYLVKFGTQDEAFDTKFRSDVLISMLGNPELMKLYSFQKVGDALAETQGIDADNLRKTPDEIEQEKQALQEAQQMQAQGLQPPQPVV